MQNYNNFCSNCVSSQQRIADKKANLPLIFKLMKNKKPKKKGEIEEVVGEILEAGKEKKEIENQSKCINCNNLLDGDSKVHTFKKGNVCHSCFLTCNSDNLKRWNDGN